LGAAQIELQACLSDQRDIPRLQIRDYTWHANRRVGKGRYRPLRIPKPPTTGA
jgi:hypothetical protein